MTPQEHLARAEDLLAGAPDPANPLWNQTDMAMSVNALAHAVIALAAELGVPHIEALSGGNPDGK